MKSAQAWIVSGLLLALVAFAARGHAAQEADDTFKTQFQKALDGGQKPEQQKLVRADARNAELWIVKLAESLANQPDPAQQAFFDGLCSTWKSLFPGEFPERVTKYFAGLDAAKKRIRADLLQRWKVAWRDFENAVEKKDGMGLANGVDEIDALSGAFESEGDLFHASEAYRAYAQSYDETLRGPSGDLHRAWTGYGHAIDMREKLDLKDAIYDELVKRKAALTARGADKKGGAVAGTPEPVPNAPAKQAPPAAATTIPLSFEVLGACDAIPRPIYGCDEIYEMWNAVPLQGKGAVATFNTTSECPPIVRAGASDIRFDTDGDKQGDEKIAMTGNILPIKVQIGRDKEHRRPWAFFAVTGAQKDSYQGIEVNLAPDDHQYVLYTLGAASALGTFGTTQLRLIDDSLDGSYGSHPERFGTAGMTSDHYEPMLDSIVVGNAKRARPWSAIQEIEGNFYRLEVQKDGTQLSIAPAGVDTGLLKLEFKGPVPPTYVVVVGSGDTKDCYYDLVEGGAKGVRVPVGNYELFYGEIRKGKKKQMQKTLIIPPTVSPPSWSVRKGETTSVTLGAPFGFDFKFEADAGKLKVKGKSVCVVGSAGERYERPWNCVARPEAAWRKKGQKNPGGDAKMPIGDLETINNKDLGWTAVWFPLDVVLDTKEKTGAFEVQLVQKKHDLFGKIESAWKE